MEIAVHGNFMLATMDIPIVQRDIVNFKWVMYDKRM